MKRDICAAQNVTFGPSKRDIQAAKRDTPAKRDKRDMGGVGGGYYERQRVVILTEESNVTGGCHAPSVTVNVTPNVTSDAVQRDIAGWRDSDTPALRVRASPSRWATGGDTQPKPDTPALRCSSREIRPAHGTGVVLAVLAGIACIALGWHLVAGALA